MSENKKKKRGRKPKNNVVINDNPVFEILNNDLIIKLSNIDSFFYYELYDYFKCYK